MSDEIKNDGIEAPMSPMEAPANENLNLPEATDEHGDVIEAPAGSETVTEDAPESSPVASDEVALGDSPHEDKPESNGSALASSGVDDEAPVAPNADASLPMSDSDASAETEAAPLDAIGSEDAVEEPAVEEPKEEVQAPVDEVVSDAPKVEEPAAVASDAPKLEEVHEEAAPIAEATDASVMEGFKDAGNALYPAMTKIGTDFESAIKDLEGEAAARFANLRDKANHFLAALEAVFSRK